MTISNQKFNFGLKKGWVGTGGLPLISSGILIILVYRERAALHNIALHWDWRILGGSFMLFTLALFIAALVWADLMRAFGSSLPFSFHVIFFILSNVMKRLPGTVWYVVSRGYLYKRHTESMWRVSTASGVELLIQIFSGSFVAIVFGGFALFSRFHFRWQVASLLLLFVLAGIGFTTIFPLILRFAAKKFPEKGFPNLSSLQLFRWAVLYTIVWILGGVILFLLTPLYFSVPFAVISWYISAWSVVGVLVVTVFLLPSNLGLTEVGLGLFLSAIMPSSVAVLLALTMRVITFVFELIFAGIILAMAIPQKSPLRRILLLE